MATSPSSTQHSRQIEPDQAWRKRMQVQIEALLQDPVSEVRKGRDQKLLRVHDDDNIMKDQINAEYETKMVILRRSADEQFQEAVRHARRQLAEVSAISPDGSCSDAIVKQQQAILDDLQRQAQKSGRGSTPNFGGINPTSWEASGAVDTMTSVRRVSEDPLNEAAKGFALPGSLTRQTHSASQRDSPVHSMSMSRTYAYALAAVDLADSIPGPGHGQTLTDSQLQEQQHVSVPRVDTKGKQPKKPLGRNPQTQNPYGDIGSSMSAVDHSRHTTSLVPESRSDSHLYNQSGGRQSDDSPPADWDADEPMEIIEGRGTPISSTPHRSTPQSSPRNVRTLYATPVGAASGSTVNKSAGTSRDAHLPTPSTSPEIRQWHGPQTNPPLPPSDSVVPDSRTGRPPSNQPSFTSDKRRQRQPGLSPHPSKSARTRHPSPSPSPISQRDSVSQHSLRSSLSGQSKQKFFRLQSNVVDHPGMATYAEDVTASPGEYDDGDEDDYGIELGERRFKEEQIRELKVARKAKETATFEWKGRNISLEKLTATDQLARGARQTDEAATSEAVSSLDPVTQALLHREQRLQDREHQLRAVEEQFNARDEEMRRRESEVQSEIERLRKREEQLRLKDQELIKKIREYEDAIELKEKELEDREGALFAQADEQAGHKVAAQLLRELIFPDSSGCFDGEAEDTIHPDSAGAWSLVELLDQILLEIGPEKVLGVKCLDIMRKLCEASRTLPQSFFLSLGATEDIFPSSRIAIEQLDKDRFFGGSADVRRASCQGRDVAVKIYRVHQSDVKNFRKSLRLFYRETVFLKHIRHPNITPFFGVAKDLPLALVCAWMDKGTVMSYLQDNPKANRVQLIAGACKGLQYLHAMKIVHGDNKGSNILVKELNPGESSDGRVVACLCDFGLAGLDPELKNPTHSVNDGSMAWMAPEVLHPAPAGLSRPIYSLKSDIYSFSMTMWQIFSGAAPFHDCGRLPSILTAILGGKRPQQLDPSTATNVGLTDDIWGLMNACWAHDSVERPNASHVLGCLEQALRNSER